MTKYDKPSSFFQGTMAPLTIRDFRLLMIGNFLWWQGRWMEMLVTGWLVLELTNSAWQVAVIGFYRSIPLLLVGIFSGTIIDRFGRRTVIWVAQAANFIIAATITLLLWLDALQLWHITIGAILMGILWSIDWPARRSLLPDLVGKGQIVEGMILENVAQNVSRIFGPFAGGTLIAVLGIEGCYTFIALISGLALLALLGLTRQPIPRDTMPDSSSPWVRIRQGLDYVRHNQLIIGVLLITLVMNMLVFAYMDLLPIFARDILEQGPFGFGLLGAASGSGSFVGLLIISRIRHRVSNSWIFAIGSFTTCLFLLAFATSTAFWLSFTLLFLSGLGRACFSVMQSSIMLLATSDEMRSQTMGTLVLAIGMGPFGRLQIGALAESFGAPSAVLFQCGLAAILVASVTLALPGFRTQGQPVRPSTS